MPDAVDLIRTKRDGQTLADDDIAWLIDAYTKGNVADARNSSDIYSAITVAVVARSGGAVTVEVQFTDASNRTVQCY